MDWIKEYSDKDDVFLINSTYWGNEIVPSDGGGWITYITDRKTVKMPQDRKGEDLCDWISENQIDYYYNGDDASLKKVNDKLDCIDLFIRK